MLSPAFDAWIDYEDPYVQPVIVEALKSTIPESINLISSSARTSQQRPLLQFRQYESIDFEKCLTSPKSLCNAYIIRKALIRKHYLSNTILSWTTKHPTSALNKHFKPAEHFELDYAEFLDDALVEAFDLRASFSRNEDKSPEQREWWILKPGMSDRGQGIRLFSTEEELQSIFEEWEVDASDDEDEDEDRDYEASSTFPTGGVNGKNDRIITSHLRHFTAQPYIHPPLLIPEAPYRNRKFHIRTYVVASGALQVYVYNPMLALFASDTYRPPWETVQPSENTDDSEHNEQRDDEDMLQRMRNVHLTNTCVQSTALDSADENVYLLSSLPLSANQQTKIRSQIHETTAELFRAALAQPTNFQPLPNAFEIYGVDFLVEDPRLDSSDNSQDEQATGTSVQLLEVNAFPDFAQTGTELRDVVVKGLFEAVVRSIIGPFFNLSDYGEMNRGHRDSIAGDPTQERMTKVLDVDAGRR